MAEAIDFQDIDFRITPLKDEEYYHCTFRNCIFEKLQLEYMDFESCQFISCNFTMTRFMNNLQDVQFSLCKMIGSDFSDLNQFSMDIHFKECFLDYANFFKKKLKGLQFEHCKLTEANFEEANIRQATFEYCDLERTSFSGCNLEKVDFSSSHNFAIDPNSCKLKGAIFSEYGLRGLVSHLNIIIE